MGRWHLLGEGNQLVFEGFPIMTSIMYGYGWPIPQLILTKLSISNPIKMLRMTAESVSYLLGQQEVGLNQHSKWTLWTGHNGFHWYNDLIIFPRFLYRLWLPSHSVSLFVVTLLSPRWMWRPPFKKSTSEPILDSCHLKWWKIFEFYFGYGVMRVKPFLKIDEWNQDFVRFR